MSRKSGSIVKHTAAELRAMRKRGETKSDWKTAAGKPLPSRRDPDDAMDEIDWATTELPAPQRKAPLTLRVDADMLGWFRAQGKGYQTKINAILRRYYQQHTPVNVERSDEQRSERRAGRTGRR
jgi:uncharacterized protein (DUF4415 family)